MSTKDCLKNISPEELANVAANAYMNKFGLFTTATHASIYWAGFTRALERSLPPEGFIDRLQELCEL